MNLDHPQDHEIPEVTLGNLPKLCERLAGIVRETGFAPEVIVYIERGARLIAAEMCRLFDCPAIAVSARRKGFGLRQLVSPITMRMPGVIRNKLRKLDEAWFWQKPGGPPRILKSAFSGSLSGRKILLVDDAVDSGRSIAGCRIWLRNRGARASDVKVAVLAATTPAGREHADFWIFDRNTRLPWSSDSPERTRADAERRRQCPPPYAPRDI